MVTINFLFWFLVILFGFIGAMRGWAKELMVTFSVILALAFSQLMEKYVPLFKTIAPESQLLFWFHTVVLGILVFFGYQTVNISRFAPKARREQLSDSLLGFFLGAINGYLIFGSILLYMSAAGFPFGDLISAPVPGTPQGDAALNLIKFMPPRLLGEPWMYFAVILSFIFVIIVFI
jgi:uncharacterized membrane protein required for colicin V production